MLEHLKCIAVSKFKVENLIQAILRRLAWERKKAMEKVLNNGINEEIESLLEEDLILRELYNRQKNSNEDIGITIALPSNGTLVSLSNQLSKDEER